ncbi:hypothetical protein M407DRAFT_23611 [Tulasnella calospora MUT 4182]|uniref:DUF6535 domain-containing protein n=1 Tax=Tulasnella calospora MUT 4182 TaxID=1051891 RepID=A0A0C3QJD2_9AGAM|nr:hypothetical protein M407DRAFT_23611 [Tulasnella calospora MUT 4182]
MTTRAAEVYDPTRFDPPVPPEVFGQDGGKFYRYYDALADEIDDNMVNGLKDQLDGLLIFAGLFAGVNTAFLALTLPLMSPDPADDTNALLRDNNAILLNLALGRNDSLPNTNALPSETFVPTGKVLTINVLFSLSLTFAIVSSFLAVLGRQWLVYYRKRSGGGPDRQRWEQLKRFLGAERWRLEWVLDDFLPSLLQIGLIIFCISLTIYLNTLHPIMSNVVGAFMCAGLAILVITAVFATWDKFCPFQSPLSHVLPWVGNITYVLIGILLILIIFLLVSITLWPCQLLVGIIQALYNWARGDDVHPPWEDITFDAVAYPFDDYYGQPIDSLLVYAKRAEETHGALQITAIKRALLTSDDAPTQAHAASNILAITDPDFLRLLATDDEFVHRVKHLWKSSYQRARQLMGRNGAGLAGATTWVYRAAIAHIVYSTNTEVWRWRAYGGLEGSIDPFATMNQPQPFPLSDMIAGSSPNMIAACLGLVAGRTPPNRTQDDRLALRSTIERLQVNPSWRCISMLTEVIMVQWRIHQTSHEQVCTAYTGKPSTVRENLELLLNNSNDPQCEDRDILREYFVDIFKLAWKASADGDGGSSNASGDLINAGRNIRGELISVLQLGCKKPTDPWAKYSGSALQETLEALLHLFTELTASLNLPAFGSQSSSGDPVAVLRHRCPDLATVGGWPTTSSNKDDDELVHLLSPILQKLNVLANTLHDWGPYWDDQDDAKFKRQVAELNAMYSSFTAAVEIVSRTIQRRKRDPDLGWCYYAEESEPHPRSE